ncbi:MAG: ORF6N domain-containing protein [Pirellulaceae bacterium]
MKAKQSLVNQQIEGVIYLVRGQRVMLDSDLAKLYSVTTFRLNEQVKRNNDRFPADFAYLLTPQEVADLISRNAISSSGHGGRRKLPRVFTEHGVAMLASVLKSPQAARVNIEIIRAFVRLRRLLATPGELISQINELAKTVNMHDEQISVITDVLKRMMDPPAGPPKPKIGFRPKMKSSSANHEPSANGARS